MEAEMAKHGMAFIRQTVLLPIIMKYVIVIVQISSISPDNYDYNAVSGMNIEHSFPKSWWGGTENNAYKDLFNLYPSPSDDNSSKGNYPMAVVTNETSSGGEGFDKVGTGTVNGQSNTPCWEPGDGWKGDFSRGYMHMATCYQNFTWFGTQKGFRNLKTYVKVFTSSKERRWS